MTNKGKLNQYIIKTKETKILKLDKALAVKTKKFLIMPDYYLILILTSGENESTNGIFFLQ